MTDRTSGESPFLRLVSLAPIGALTLALSCPPWVRGPLAPRLTSRTQEISECPLEHTTDPDSALALAGPITGIPEFHDCQRFIRHQYNYQEQWRDYGTLAAIWVRDRLDTVPFPGPQPVGGVIQPPCDSVSLVAPALPTCWRNDSSTTTPAPATTKIGVAVALIWSESAYRLLGIKSGYNCLYMFEPWDWKAKMVPVADQKECLENRDLATVTGTNLEVRKTAVGWEFDDYPPVVRWEQGIGSRYRQFRYYIGIKCLAAWCEIGRGPFQTRHAYEGGRTRAIKGWYDEQHLAVHTPEKQWPTRILATTFPDQGLDVLNRSTWSPGWHPVARTWLRPEPKPIAGTAPVQDDEFQIYGEKFNFELGETIDDVNTIFFCQGDQQSCFADENASPPLCDLPGQGGNPVTASSFRFWAKVVSVSKKVSYRCVTYTPHQLGYSIPGVVRWRWLFNDEKGWESCPSGCCQVDPQ